MKPIRPWREVLQEWAPELSEKLGRTAEQIQAKGLSAYDFSPSLLVEVRTPGGAVFRFPFAVAAVRPSTAQAAVRKRRSR